MANKERAGSRVGSVAAAGAMAPLSLSQLLDAAITSDGADVNFRELHSLLRAVLGLLGLGDLPVPDCGQPAQGGRALAQHVGQQPPEPAERQPGTAPLQGAASSSGVDAVEADVEQLNELEAMESSSSEVGALSSALGSTALALRPHHPLHPSLPHS